MKNVFKISYILIALLSLALVFVGIQWWKNKSVEHVEQNATVLLERIKRVAKLTTVEGHFSELFEQKSFTYFDISPFQKKVLVRVHAKVAVGFDFEGLKIEVDSTHKIIWINDLPEPQILYIDHKLDYYDISEGIFTSFNEADYNQIQNQAKEMIRQKAYESTLVAEAKTQGKELKDMLELITKASGWDIKYRSRPKLD